MATSSRELIDKLAKAPTKVKAGILAAVLVAFGALYYFVGIPGLISSYSDLSASLDSAKSRKTSLAEQKRQLEKKANDYNDLLRQMNEVQGRLAKNMEKLPASKELPAFLEHLQTQASIANVKIVSWTWDKEVPVESYMKVPINLVVEGDYYQLLQYFKLLFEESRIISVENLSIGGGKWESERWLLTAKFDASTFRQVDRPGGPAPNPAQQPPPGATPAAAGTPPAGTPATPKPAGK